MIHQKLGYLTLRTNTAESEPKFVEKAFSVLALVFFTQGLIILILTGGDRLSEFNGSPITKFIWFGIYFSTSFFLLISKKIKYVFLALISEKSIILILVFAALSVFWSSDSSLSLNKVIGLFGSTLFGVYLALRYNVREQVYLLSWCFTICILLSFLFALFIPELGKMQEIHVGAWRGIYNHKNALARLMNWSCLVFLILFLERGGKKLSRLWPVLFFFSSVFLILLSTAGGALLTLIILIAVFPFFKSFRWSLGYIFPFLVIVSIFIAACLTLVSANIETIFSFIGKDITLSGRTDLWPDVISYILDKPFLGYGYSGFWNGWNGPSGGIWNIHSWLPPHAHNGFLDLWLDLGLVGLLIYVIGYLRNLVRASFWARRTNSYYDYWPLIVMLSVVLFNLTESVTIRQNNIYWIVYSATAITLSIRRPKQAVRRESSIKETKSEYVMSSAIEL